MDALKEEKLKGHNITALARSLRDAREAFLRQDFEDAASRAETVLVLCKPIDPPRRALADPGQEPRRGRGRALPPFETRSEVAYPPPEPGRASRKKRGLAIGAVVLASVVVVVVLFGALRLWPASQKLPAYLAKLGVNQAEWRYESPSLSTHTPRGQYYLWLHVSINNSGTQSIGVQSVLFNLRWSGETAGVPGSSAWASFDLAPGRSANLTIAFPSVGLKTPDRLDFQYSPSASGHVQASIPTPSAPATEVTFGPSSAQWKTVDTYGSPPGGGKRFLWLTFAMRNEWDTSVVITIFDFKAEGQDGSSYRASQRQSPENEIAPGGTVTVALVFEVPSTWMPKVLHYDMIGGPWADLGISTPSGP